MQVPKMATIPATPIPQFPSTTTPKTNNPKETAKCLYDLVQKVNTISAAMTSNINAINSNVSVLPKNTNGVIQPIASNIGTNTTYTMPNVAGNYYIYIPASLLVSTGSACTLYISSGTGAQIAIPISASGATGLVSLYLPFYIDTSGNCVASGQEITSGSNSNGSYIQFSDGTMICRKTYGATANGTTITFPIAFISAPEYVGAGDIPSSSGAYNYIAAGIITTSNFMVVAHNGIGSPISEPFSFCAIGRWK